MKTTIPANIPTTALELKVLIASAPVPAYVLGARARIHPVTLSRLIHGREPLTKDLATRVALAVAIERRLHGG